MSLTEEDKNYFQSFPSKGLAPLKKISSTYIRDLDVPLTTDISEIFNLITPTQKVPFASWKKLSKVRRGFTPTSTEWFEESDNISLYFNRIPTAVQNFSLDVENDDVGSAYDEAQIQRTTSGFVVFIEYEFIKESETIGDIFNFIKTALGGSINLAPETERDIESEFDVIDQTIDQFVIMDMILVNKYFAEYLSLEESFQTKKTYLTVKFHPPGLKAFTFTLTQQIMEDDIPFVHVNIKGAHPSASIDSFRNILSKLMALYNAEKESVIAIYASLKMVPKKSKDGTKKQTKKKRGIFAGKSQLCQDNVTEAETYASGMELVEGEANRVMEFDSKFYVCIDNAVKTWPGITKPSKKYPGEIGIPCCFMKDQVADKKSALSKFRAGTYFADAGPTTLHILQGDKVLDAVQQGYLPNVLLGKFNQFLETPAHVFLRYGVVNSPKSILYCLSMISGVVVDMDVLLANSALAKQEMYDYPISEIRNVLDRDEGVVDWRLFVSLLEGVFKLNIYLYDRKGEMVTPRYKHGYYTCTNDYPSVIVYESTNSPFARYEMISEVVGNEKRFVFEAGSDISRYLFESRRSMISFEDASGIPIITSNATIEIGGDYGVIGQAFDSFGKTRVVELKHIKTGYILTVHTSPLKPFNAVEIIPRDSVGPGIEQRFGDLALDLNITNRKVVLRSDGRFSELSYSRPGLDMRIVIPAVPGVVESPTIGVATRDGSKLTDYLKKRRTSRYIIEYAYWMYYMSETSPPSEWAKSAIAINPDYIYTGMTKEFTMKSGVIKNGQLILTSEEAEKRILFLLEMAEKRFISGSRRSLYKSLIMVPDYYVHPGDYRTPTQKNNAYDIHYGASIMTDNIEIEI